MPKFHLGEDIWRGFFRNLEHPMKMWYGMNFLQATKPFQKLNDILLNSTAKFHFVGDPVDYLGELEQFHP